MKKKLALFVLPLLTLTANALLSGCSSTTDKTNTIYLEYFNKSGFGKEWLDNMINEWKAATSYKDFDVIVVPSSYLGGDQVNQIESGTSLTDIFFGSNPEYKTGFYLNNGNGFFEDLTDLVNSSAYGESKLIKEKIPNFDSTWKETGGKQTYDSTQDKIVTSGLYLLPYTSTFTAPIFNYDDWLEKGLLTTASSTDEVKSALTSQGIMFHEQNSKLIFDSASFSASYVSGDVILTPGKDNKYGTYDDGQPVTFDEFKTMYSKMLTQYINTSITSDKGCYSEDLVLDVFAQINGIEGYNAIAKFDSEGKEITLSDGSKEVITYENGNHAYKQKGVKTAMDFFYDYFLSTKEGYTLVEQYVGDAQAKYCNGLFDSKHSIGTIYEGNWFENQAKDRLASALKNHPNNHLGKFDFRYLLVPNFEGQQGIDGKGNGTCLTASEYGSIAVTKQNDSKKLEAIKDLLKFFLSDEQMAKATCSSGISFAYDYALTDEQLNSMAPSQKYAYQIMHDKENVRILAQTTDKVASPMYFGASLGSTAIIRAGKNNSFASPYGYMKTGTTQEFANDFASSYSDETWSSLVSEMKNYININK